MKNKLNKILIGAIGILLILGIFAYNAGTATQKTIALNQSNVITQYSNIKLSLIRKLKLIPELLDEVNNNLGEDSQEYKELLEYKESLGAYTRINETGEMFLKKDLTKKDFNELYKKIIAFNIDKKTVINEKVSKELISKIKVADSNIETAFTKYNELIDLYDKSKKTFLGQLISSSSDFKEFEKIDFEKE